MMLSCKMHNNCFSLVCCLQGSYRALKSSAEVMGRFLHNIWYVFDLINRSTEAVDCSAASWKFGPRSKLFWSFDFFLTFENFPLLGAQDSWACPLCRVQNVEDSWLMSLAPTIGARRCQCGQKLKPTEER